MEAFKTTACTSIRRPSAASSSHPLYYRRHELPPMELEDGELQGGVGNHYLSQQNGAHQEIPFTRREYNEGISHSQSISHNNNQSGSHKKKLRLVPFADMRYNTATNDNQGQSQQPAPSHYCHLSYYGEEVDKEYLPHLANNDGYPKANQLIQPPYEYKPHVEHLGLQGFGLLNSNHSHQASQGFLSPQFPQPQFNIGRSEVPDEARIAGRRHDFVVHPSYRQQPFMQQESHQNHEAFHRSNMVVSVKQEVSETFTPPSPPESFSSFETAATSFQEKQAEQITNNSYIIGAKTLPGWSRVTSNAPIQRRVTILDEEEHETKMQQRLNRFGKPVKFSTMPRRKARELSLDEIIKIKKLKTILTNRGGISPRPPHPYKPRFTGSSHRQASMWLSGDGRRFTDPTIAYRRENEKVHYRDNFKSTEYNGPREHFYGRRDQQPHFREGRHDKAKREFDRYPETKEPVNRRQAQLQFMPIVIDGTSVAFTFGEDLHFACEGIKLCVNYFLETGYRDITVIVPRDRLRRDACKDVQVLHDLKKQEMLLVNWAGQFAGNGNDGEDRLFILDVACHKQGIVISNTNFAEVAHFHPELYHRMWNKVVKFQFTSTTPRQIIFPDIDPTGMYRPTWEDVFRM